MWEDSIDANSPSAEAAPERGNGFGRAQGHLNEIHALDFLVCAYLQRGEHDKAKEIVYDINSRTNLKWKNRIVTFTAPPQYDIRWSGPTGKRPLPLIHLTLRRRPAETLW